MDTVTVTVQGARIQKKQVTKNKEEEERKGRKPLEKRLDENVARRIIWRRRRRNIVGGPAV